jgi:acetyl esterase/lipase
MAGLATMSHAVDRHSSPAQHRKWPRRLAVTSAAIIGVLAITACLVANNTQLIVGAFQGYQTQNSYEPRNAPAEHVRDNGVRYVNDLEYGTEYPNSHLDISYPENGQVGRLPTIVFTHGGGFFGGDKVLGDPLAIDSDVNFVFDRLVEQGYAFVNVNYALVPEYQFPTPVHQLDEALGFLRDHADDYQLDMENVIIMGSSAGAIMTAQYGAALANPGYADLLNLSPSIPLDSVRALLIDDAPLAISDFDLATMVLIGNYIDGTVHPSAADRARYNPIDDVTAQYPPSFLLGSNYDGDGYAHDMELLGDALKENGVHHEFFYERRDDGSEANHGLLGGLPTGDQIAVDAFDQMLGFLESVPTH